MSEYIKLKKKQQHTNSLTLESESLVYYTYLTSKSRINERHNIKMCYKDLTTFKM